MRQVIDFKSIKYYVEHWFYNDVFCVVRTQPPGKSKEILPWTYTKETGWVNKYILDGMKPLYNVMELFNRYDATVLVVEGEKTAEAAKKLFPEYVVTTWSGGAQSYRKTDFSNLSARKIILWPDNDEPGLTVMQKLGKELVDLSCSVDIIDVMDLDKPMKWDLADCETSLEAHSLLNACLHPFRCTKEMKTFPHLNSQGKPLNTIENLKHLLDHYNIKAQYNMMTHIIEVHREYCSYSQSNAYDSHLADIGSLCVLNGVPKGDVHNWILPIADKARYSPIIDYIESKPWDGISRIEEFCNTVESEDKSFADKIIYRWMMGAIHAAYCEEGIGLPGVLTFQGEQGVGKTQWFNRLAPPYLIKENLTLDANNKDSVASCIKCWLGEFGEVDNTFNRSSISALKGFVTRSKDYYRPPYGRSEKEFPRRTAYFASVNHRNFLIDETGNRRWWVISVTKINYLHEIDMQQLWAEFRVLMKKGETFIPTKNEQDMINESNKSFESIDPIEELILNRFKWEENDRPLKMSATEVLDCIGVNLSGQYSKSSSNRCSMILTKLTGKKSTKFKNRRVFCLPRINIMQ